VNSGLSGDAASLSLLMLDQIAEGSESLGALSTTIRLLTGVNTHVIGQMGVFVESLMADFAFIRHNGVLSGVSHEGTLVFVGLATHSTAVMVAIATGGFFQFVGDGTHGTVVSTSTGGGDGIDGLLGNKSVGGGGEVEVFVRSLGVEISGY